MYKKLGHYFLGLWAVKWVKVSPAYCLGLVNREKIEFKKLRHFCEDKTNGPVRGSKSRESDESGCWIDGGRGWL